MGGCLTADPRNNPVPMTPPIDIMPTVHEDVFISEGTETGEINMSYCVGEKAAGVGLV